MPWGSPIEVERRNRIRLSVAALSYEKYDDSIMSDAEFDALSLKIHPTIKTGNKKLDSFFAKEFNPSTGVWIHKHPDRAGLDRIYQTYFKGRPK